MANNHLTGPRTKHIAIKYHFIKDQIAAGNIVLQYVPSIDNIADFLTKPLVGERFVRMREELLLRRTTGVWMAKENQHHGGVLNCDVDQIYPSQQPHSFGIWKDQIWNLERSILSTLKFCTGHSIVKGKHLNYWVMYRSFYLEISLVMIGIWWTEMTNIFMCFTSFVCMWK